MTVETISLIIATFVSGSLAVAAMMRNYRSRTCWYFASFLALLFVHDALCILEKFEMGTRFTSHRVHALVVVLVGPIAYLFFKRVANDLKPLPLLFWGYLPLALGAFLFSGSTFVSIRPWVFVGSHLLFAVAAALIVRLLARAESQATLTREKLRLRYALWGAVITIAFFVTDAAYYSGFDVLPLGTFARLIYVLFLFQTFIQKELVTAQEVFGKLFLFGGISLILSSIYLLLVSWVGDRTGLFFFNTFIASFVIIVLFEPIRRLTHWGTRKLLVHRNSAIAEALSELSMELRGIMQPKEIVSRLEKSFGNMLDAKHVNLFALSKDGLSHIAASTKAEEVYASDPIIEYMNTRWGRPFLLESIENDRDTYYARQTQKYFAECAESMRRIDADFIVPCMHDASLLGFIAVKLSESTVLSNEQLRLFVPLGKQVASQLGSMQIVNELRHRDKLAAAGEMAAGLAHEIKNPLGAIKGAAQLLAEDPSVNRNDFLNVIVDESNRLSLVLSEFLEYAKPRRGIPVEACDLEKVVEHTFSLVSQEGEVKLDMTGLKPAPNLQLDPETLKQILLNLFMNGIDAVSDTGRVPVLTVRSRELGRASWYLRRPSEKDLSRRYLELEVIDNGVGISEANQEKMFKPFFTTKPKGTGLGLAICQRLVEGVGGTLSARPHKPHGSAMVLHLPLGPIPTHIGSAGGRLALEGNA